MEKIVRLIEKNIYKEEFVVSKDKEMTIVFVCTGNNQDVDITIRLHGNGSRVWIYGLAMGSPKSKIFIHTSQIHESPYTVSNLLIKSVVPEAATFHFQGNILVTKKAKRADAYQKNQNILLKENAKAETSPQLEIENSDVKCSHGATTMPIPEDEIWYMKTRGISDISARKLFIEGFVDDILSNIPDRQRKEIQI